MSTYRVIVGAVIAVAVLAAGVKAQDSVAGVSNELYYLGVKAAKAEDPEVKQKLLQDIKKLQEKLSQMIANGEAPAVNSTAAAGPAAAQPPATAPATNWSRGSYGGNSGYGVAYGGGGRGGSYPGYSPPFRISQPTYGGYPLGPAPPWKGVNFGLGLQRPSPWTIGGYSNWKGPRFTKGSYPIRFK